MDTGPEEPEIDFLFDIIVTNMEIFKAVQEPERLEAQVKFAGMNIKVTPSRVNVSDFVNNRKLGFKSSPYALRSKIEDQGLQIAARYDGSTLGTNVLLFPDSFIDKICPTMSDLYHEETFPLIRRSDCVGSISILLILNVKCTDLDIVKPEEARRSSSRRSSRKSSVTAIPIKKVEDKVDCQGLGPTINPQDVMFLVGDPDPLLKVPKEPCPELPSEEGDDRLTLDLQRYTSLQNRRVIFPDDDPCPKEKPSFSELKKLTDEYAKYIELVSEKVKKMEVPTRATEAPAEKDASTSLAPEEAPDDRWIPVPIRDDTEYGIRPIRFCPVCLYTLSWLPKFTPCPKCNTKPRPVLEGHPDGQMTANQIIAEQLVRPKIPDENDETCIKPCPGPIRKAKKAKKKNEMDEFVPDSESDLECPPCRCTCTQFTICAHCRIRRMCEDIFKKEDSKSVVERIHIEVPQPGSSEDFCVIPEPINDRPYLSRVLTELKNLYTLHDTNKLLQIKKRCESQTLLPSRSSKSTIGMRSFHNDFDAHIPGAFHRISAGHKTCLPVDKNVPRHHGWDWPRSPEARKHGWRPGSILRAAAQVMRYFLMSKQERGMCQRITFEHEERERRAQPVLNICKKDGVIFVTLRALPTLEMKQRPITFRIVKSELALALRQIKSSLKGQGFRKCTCHKSLMMCTCRNALEKFELNKALEKECQRHVMEPCPEHLVLTDTSVSDLEFDLDVTPPAGTQWTKGTALRNVVNHETQTQAKGIPSIEPQYPVQDSPQWRAFDCAAGDRYMGTPFGNNVETVFEDGIFGYRGGGQHGRPPFPRDRKVWGRRIGAPMPIAKNRQSIDPYTFTRTVWKSLPKKIIKQMRTNRTL